LSITSNAVILCNMYASLICIYCLLVQFHLSVGACSGNEAMATFNDRKNPEVAVELLIEYLKIKYPEFDFNEFVYVGVKRQELYHVKDNKLVEIYDVSTAINGVGNKDGSHQTPIGLHRIQAKIGQNVPLGGVFVGKKYTGKTANISIQKLSSTNDDITSRVLTLQGEEIGVNYGTKDIDSYRRKIYIHGTPEEGLIGQPASHGCIRMKNKEIIELFEKISVGTMVIILNN